MSNDDPRLDVFLNGFELHIYNRSKLYSELEKVFNLPSRIFEAGDKRRTSQADEERRKKILKTMNENPTVAELKQSIWRDLFPATRFMISSGRFVFGNHLIPSSLSITFEESSFIYTSRPAMCVADLFTHIVKGKAENMQVILVPSPSYTSAESFEDEPPRFMGDGFIVFRTNKIDIYYYQDEPGFVVAEDSGNDSPPAWGTVIKCGKGTDFSYGPWADRQRDYLYGFFFPSNYQVMPVYEKPNVSELRQFESFDIRLSTLSDAKIDILFTKNGETKALHINAGPGSYLEATIPWVYKAEGYKTHILGQILHLDATTSLQYRPLISSETLEFDVQIHYPSIWNDHQEWICKITACKATVDLIFAHKVFICDLIDDWSDRNRADILKFIPYTWRISIVIKEFELLVLANEFNWIDCSTMGAKDENCKIAVCGEHFDMAFDLPFVEFLPSKLAIKIWIQGECLEGAFYLPECCVQRDVVEVLQLYSQVMCRDGTKASYLSQFGQSRKWKNVVSRTNHWHECMSAPIVALSITYDYFPMPVMELMDKTKSDDHSENGLQFNQTKADHRAGDESLLKILQQAALDPASFDPLRLDPDVMTLELEIGPMNLAVFGVLFRFLWNIKENYLGESQVFSEMSASFFDDKFELKKRAETVVSEKEKKNVIDIDAAVAAGGGQQVGQPNKAAVFDARLYRPFDVVVSVTLHEIQGHLVQAAPGKKDQTYAPLVFVEKLCFELQKSYQETKLQLIISPAVLQVADGLPSTAADPLLESTNKEGFLTLSSLQFRGHAMFSNLDRPIESETLEYAWLVDVEVGEIDGRLTLDQLAQIVVPLENFLFQVIQADLELQPPIPFKKCLHDALQNECIHSNFSDQLAPRLCPYSEDLKYRMVRVIFNPIELYLLEASVAIRVGVPQVKLATCNLHVADNIDGFTMLITDVSIRQFVYTSMNNPELSGKNITNWIEVSSISTGPLFIDTAFSSSGVDEFAVSQVDFIRKHDAHTKRIWFLWSEASVAGGKTVACGCVGNCTFFGCNLDGQLFFDKYQNRLVARPDGYTPPKKNDHRRCLGAKFHDHSNVLNPDYGESLLHPGQFLLEINSPLIVETNKAILNTRNSDSSSSKRPTDSMVTSMDSATSHNMTSSYLSVDSMKPSTAPTTTERFFSAEDLSLNTKIKSTMSSSGTAATGFLSSSASWNTPQAVFSADDVTSASRYYTARQEMMATSSQRPLGHASANTSNATLQKLTSLSSDSSPTLVGSIGHDRSDTPQNAAAAAHAPEAGKHHYRKKDYDTISETSFATAKSDQQENYPVDLRHQLEKPIIESPLLMNIYSTYMSQYQCEYLDKPPPFPLYQAENINNYFDLKSTQALHFERLLFEYRTQWKPKFILKKPGFTQTRFVHRNLPGLSENKDGSAGHFYDTHFVPGIVAKRAKMVRAKNATFLSDKEVMFSRDTGRNTSPLVMFGANEKPEAARSRTATFVGEDSKVRADTVGSEQHTLLGTHLVKEQEDNVENIVVHVQLGEIEIKVTPITLDVLASFISSATKYVARLHPINYLNHLNLLCQSSVESRNRLKKEKLIYLGQLHMRAWKLLKRRQTKKDLNRTISFSDRASKMVHDMTHASGNALLTNSLLVDQKLSLVVTGNIACVNISSLQASLVEELISFSILDRVNEFTCVSMLNVSLANIDLNFTRQYRRRQVLQIVMEQSSSTNLSFAERALITRFFTKKPKKTCAEIDISANEKMNAYIEETSSGLTVRHVHMQLSRLVNAPDVLTGATLTVIPSAKTRVDFLVTGPLATGEELTKVRRNMYAKKSASTSSNSSKKLLRRQGCVREPNNSETTEEVDVIDDTSSDGQQLEHFDRFIMFEAGFEKLSFTFFQNSLCNAVKLSPPTPAPKEPQNLNLKLDLEVIDFSSKPKGETNFKGELTRVWLHFASPPKMVHHTINKNHFTRDDWHLLSCAVPLSIAWVSSLDRMLFNLSNAERALRFRTTSTIACLLANVLNDVSEVNASTKKNVQFLKPLLSNSKQLIRILSPLAKTLQEDASMHIINSLRANFRQAFATIGEFEQLFENTAQMPKTTEMERAIVLFLLHLKENTNPSSPIYFKTNVNVGGGVPSKAPKNQLLALFEEKTKQFNLPRPEFKLGVETCRHGKVLEPQDETNITPNVTVQANDEDYEMIRLLPLNQTKRSDCRCESFRDDMNDLEVCSQGTKNTASENEAAKTKRQQTSSGACGAAAGGGGGGRQAKRVKFLSRAQAKGAYDQFLALPVVRNVSILVHGTNSAISSACHRLRVAVVGPRSSNVAADVEAQVELRPLKSGADSYIELSEPEVINTTGNNNNNKGNNDQGEVRLALPTEGYDPYDSVQVNGRYSSYSNYDKKDSLYWWMVKQQDFMKPNTGAGNFSSSNPFKSNPVFRAGEAFESSPYDKNNIEQQQHQQQQQQPPDKDEEEVEPKKVDEAGGIASGAAASDERKPSLEFEVFQTFESLVTLLGLDAVCQVSASSANDFVVFGTKILSTVKVKQFCIDIDETEHDLEKNILLHDKWPLLLPHLNNNRPHHNDSQHSAFICDQLNIEAIVLKKLLTQSNDVIVGSLREHFEGSTTTNPTSASIAGLVGRILTDLDKKVVNEEIFWNHNQAAIVVSFSVQVGQVVQRINLPLLRLVHQFSAMYENVVQTRFEMRTNRAYPEQDLLASLASKRKRRPFDIDNISVNSMSTIEENSSRSNSISEATTPQPPYFVVNIDEEPDMVGSNESLANMSISEQQMLFDRRQKVWKAVYIMAEEYKLLRSQAFLNNSLATLNPKSEAANIAAALLAESNNVNNMNNNLKAMLNYGCINEEAILKAHPRFMSLATPAIIIAGSGVVKRMNLVAMLSGLKLDGDLTNFGFNLTRHQYFKHLKPTAKIEQQQQPNNFPLITTKCMKNMSVNVSLERTQISLFEEGVFCLVQQEPTTSMMGNITQQLVVKMLVGQSNVGLAHQAETNEEFAYTAELLFDANPIATSGTNDDDNSSAEANIKYTNSARVSIGAIEIDIPQHPVALHGMMTRSSKQLSTTLQELRSSRQPSRLSRQQTMTQSNTSNMAESTQFPPSPLAHAQTSSSSNTQASLSEQQQQQQQPASRSMHMPLTPKIIVQTRQQQQQQSSQLNNAGGGRLNFGDRSSPNPVPKMKNLTRKQQQQQMFANHEPVQPLIPFLVDFTFLLESFTIQASLLPSLRAQYRIEQVSSSGYTGARAKFNIEVNHHSLCFNTKIDANTTTDTNLPTEASINLPRIHVGAEYLEESTKRSAPDIGRSEIPSKFSCHLPTLSEDIVFRKGNFLEMIAEIGAFEHCLTTDLLNHLLFVQKVFMKEVNEVVQKMSRNEPNNFIILGDALKTSTDTAASSYQHWEASNGAGGASRSILFCLHLRMTGIQITATTPTNSAVRFETGAIDLHLSNRVMNMSPRDYFSSKILVQVELDFNVALGQLIRNTIFEEAEPDFQQLAYFKTQIKMRNALRDEIQKDAADKEGDDDDDDEEEEEDKEMVFITLNQPLVYIQPMALDKAVLVWINYRNAYEYWNEQRANLNTEVIQATQQVIDRVQPLTQSLGSNQSVATLFLQLIVNDFGICLPISSQLVGTFPNQTRIFDADGKDALVLTLETTRISACSKDSLVSIAQFKNLCIRFADDFDTGMDDWKPNLDDPSIKNLCIVSEGTYEICSRTITHHVLMQGDKNSPAKTVGGGCEEGTVADAKWILNVSWKMDGFDIHVDTSIGKHISALFKTMTAIAGDEDDYDDDDEEDEEEEDEETNLPSSESAPVKTSSMANILNEGKARPRLLTSHSIDETIDMREKEKTSTSADEDNSVRWTSSDGQAEELLTSSKMPLKKRSSTMKGKCFVNNFIRICVNFSPPADIKEFNRRPSARTIEKELNEQVKLINDLRQLGASNQTIQQEIKRSKELEAALFNYFRRDMFKKLKRSSSKATATPTSSKKKGDFQKTRAFSTSLYTYREAEWTKDEQAMPSTPAADVVDDQNELGSSEEKVNEMLKIRSSTIPSFRLANEQLMTLSSGDEGSITDIDESQSTSPRTPYTNTSSTKEFDFEPVAGQSHSQPATVHSSPVNHAELKSSQQQQQQSQPTTTSTAYLTSAEPRIDFELDVKIFFNSGQCVLHTKDQKTSDAADASFNRNFSSVDIGGGAGSNSNTEHASNMSPSLSSSQIAARSSINKSRSGAKLSRGYRSTSTQPDFTVFLIPGLDIKLYYSSKSILAQHEAENEQAHFRNPNCSADGGKRASSATSGGGNATRPDTTSAASLQRPKVTKKASLYAWITLSSIPDEICISPHILDFFEEALKPIPITVSSANNSANATMSSAESKRNQELLGSVADKEAGGNAADSTPAAPQYVYYASFPVDVIVFFHFQPTIIQLCCLPVSRVECLLHLPSIDLVMSSKGSDFELDHNLDSPHSLQQLSARTYKNLTKSVSIYLP